MLHKKNTATWDHLVLVQRTVHTPVVPKGIIILQIYTAVLNDRQPPSHPDFRICFQKDMEMYVCFWKKVSIMRTYSKSGHLKFLCEFSKLCRV